MRNVKSMNKLAVAFKNANLLGVMGIEKRNT